MKPNVSHYGHVGNATLGQVGGYAANMLAIRGVETQLLDRQRFQHLGRVNKATSNLVGCQLCNYNTTIGLSINSMR